MQAEMFNCTSKDDLAPNCTNKEIIPGQWGESWLTYRKPLFDNTSEDSVFIPTSWSLYNWGGVSVPRIFAPPELSAYSEPPYYSYWDRTYTP